MFVQIRENSLSICEFLCSLLSFLILGDIFFASHFLAHYHGISQLPLLELTGFLMVALIFLWLLKREYFHFVIAGALVLLSIALPITYNPTLMILIWLHIAFAILFLSIEEKYKMFLMKAASALFYIAYFISGVDLLLNAPSTSLNTLIALIQICAILPIFWKRSFKLVGFSLILLQLYSLGILGFNTIPIAMLLLQLFVWPRRKVAEHTSP